MRFQAHDDHAPGGTRSDPHQQLIEQARVHVMACRRISGCRAIVLSRKLA